MENLNLLSMNVKMDNRKINFTAVGDIMFGEMPENIGYGVKSYLSRKGFNSAFNAVKKYFIESDIVHGNIEAVLSEVPNSKNIEEISLIADKKSIASLEEIKLTIANVANNHSLDHGVRKYSESVDRLIESNINVIGSQYKNLIFQFIKKGGIKFLFIGFSLAEDKNHKKDYYYKPENIDEILEIIAKYKNDVNHIIVSVHWGKEHVSLPSPEQINIGHKLIDSGASLILGHHPHCYQGIEEYKNGIIVYSLGNFVFDMSFPKSRESIVFKCEFDRYGIISKTIIPIKIDKNGIPQKPDNDMLQQKFKIIDTEISNIFDLRVLESTFKKEYKKSYNNFKLHVKLNFIRNIFRMNPRFSYQLFKKYLYKLK